MLFRPDPSKIFVCVGFGFFVEFTMTEAVNFIDKKCAHLTSLSDNLTQDAARIKAHIKLVLEVSLTLVLVNMCVIFNMVFCVMLCMMHY